MFKIIRKSEATIRQVNQQKLVENYITKEISPNVSFAISEETNYLGEEDAKYDRIYFVLKGQLELIFGNEAIILESNDSCFIQKGTKYTLKGTFRSIIINSPAYGS